MTVRDERRWPELITTKTTFTAAPPARSESAFMLLGAGYGARNAAMWRHVDPTFAVDQSVDVQPNPIFTRDRAVIAAKQGSPPRGVQR
jgi:hypothetical protein